MSSNAVRGIYGDAEYAGGSWAPGEARWALHHLSTPRQRTPAAASLRVCDSTSLCQPRQGRMLEPTSGVPDKGGGGCPVFECLVQRPVLNYLKDENSPHGNAGAALTC